MDSQTAGLQELSAFMEGHGIGYAVIGGLVDHFKQIREGISP